MGLFGNIEYFKLPLSDELCGRKPTRPLQIWESGAVTVTGDREESLRQTMQSGYFKEEGDEFKKINT